MDFFISFFKTNKNQLITFSFSFIYLTIFLYSNFGSVDKSFSQGFILSNFNINFLTYIFFNNFHFNLFKKILNFRSILFFFLFISVSILSTLFSYNYIESIIKIFYWINLLSTILIITYFFNHFKFSVTDLLIVFLFSFCLQVYFSASTFIQIIYLTQYDFSYASLLKGVTSNKNITSALFIFHTPIIFYFIAKSRKNLFKIFLSLFLFLVVLLIFSLSSRATYISLLFVFISILIYCIFTKHYKLFLYTFLPFVLATSFFQFSNSFTSNLDLTSRISTVNIQDESTSLRLRFYQHAIDYLISNPFTPIGPGNWKIKSIKLDSQNIKGYTVPYHVHNDFLEIGVETSIIGLFLYMMIFFSLFKSLFVMFQKSSDKLYRLLCFVIFLSLSTYIIDSMLNFPHARVVQQIPLVFLISLVIYLFQNQVYETKK